MTESMTEETAGTTAGVPRRPTPRRASKLDAVLAAAVERAREGVLEIAPAEQVGEHAGTFADGDRLVTHRFEAKLAGYAGWQWYATLARVPRGKVATVCEAGLLPSERSLLAPEWLPWADRVRPEEVAAEQDAADTGERPDGAAEQSQQEAAGTGEPATGGVPVSSAAPTGESDNPAEDDSEPDSAEANS